MRLLEENSWGDIAVLPGLLPCLADDAALGSAEDTALIVCGDGGDGGRDSSGSGTGLRHFTYLYLCN